MRAWGNNLGSAGCRAVAWVAGQRRLGGSRAGPGVSWPLGRTSLYALATAAIHGRCHDTPDPTRLRDALRSSLRPRIRAGPHAAPGVPVPARGPCRSRGDWTCVRGKAPRPDAAGTQSARRDPAPVSPASWLLRKQVAARAFASDEALASSPIEAATRKPPEDVVAQGYGASGTWMCHDPSTDRTSARGRRHTPGSRRPRPVPRVSARTPQQPLLRFCVSSRRRSRRSRRVSLSRPGAAANWRPVRCRRRG